MTATKTMARNPKNRPSAWNNKRGRGENLTALFSCFVFFSLSLSPGGSKRHKPSCQSASYQHRSCRAPAFHLLRQAPGREEYQWKYLNIYSTQSLKTGLAHQSLAVPPPLRTIQVEFKAQQWSDSVQFFIGQMCNNGKRALTVCFLVGEVLAGAWGIWLRGRSKMNKTILLDAEAGGESIGEAPPVHSCSTLIDRLASLKAPVRIWMTAEEKLLIGRWKHHQRPLHKHWQPGKQILETYLFIDIFWWCEQRLWSA